MRKITGQAVLLLTPLVAILGLTLFGGKCWDVAAVLSLPVTLMYCISNVIFLLILRNPLGSILGRLRNKYGLFCEDEFSG